ncbi:hypothetical protein FLL46_07165 [Aliikangiella coralliicola]|uniref:Uncharacterized protein n=1 Tax=Aliikangiella coralliicola TaxID=2592383 RepID=A0A545UGR3_9GAMM|nr:hypothetical protein FLL46_07165 [Aliikangiella coralliicola]
MLQVEPSSLNAVNKNLGPGKWRLTRLDDNGNEIEMYVFQEEHCARAVRTLFERRGHKQDYYVNEIT